eukprot:12674454-Heterocapsa_arctica.AAC.1
MKAKTHETCVQALRDFAGPEPIKKPSSDNAPELLKAGTTMMNMVVLLTARPPTVEHSSPPDLQRSH